MTYHHILFYFHLWRYVPYPLHSRHVVNSCSCHQKHFSSEICLGACGHQNYFEESLAISNRGNNKQHNLVFPECAKLIGIMASTTAASSDLTSEVLQALSQNDEILSSETFPTHKSADIKSSLDRLASRSMIIYKTIDREEAVLEPEAQEIAANGSHEARVFEALRKAVEGLTVSELEAAVGDKNVAKVGQGKAFKSKWIAKGKEGRLVATVSFRLEVGL